jgi:hypothetical protein
MVLPNDLERFSRRTGTMQRRRLPLRLPHAATYDACVGAPRKEPRKSTPSAKPAPAPSRSRVIPAAATDPRLARVQRMCERRAFRERETSITREVSEIARQAARDLERRGSFAEAWAEAMPAELVAETWIESATPVQLLVGVTGSAAAFAVDRALRAGALAALRTRLQAPGLRVRTRVGRSPA